MSNHKTKSSVLRQTPGVGHRMAIIVFIFFFLSFEFYSCGQDHLRRKTKPIAINLNNKIIPFIDHLDNADSCRQALLYLDSATAIDNGCFTCYVNKLMFLSVLEQYDKAIIANDNCIRLRPNAHDLYLTGGMLYTKIDDTIKAKGYFKKSLSICNNVLDTMNIKNNDYDMLTMNKAINIIMLDDSIKGNQILTKLYNRENDEAYKEMIKPFINKSKREIIEESFIKKPNSR